MTKKEISKVITLVNSVRDSMGASNEEKRQFDEEIGMLYKAIQILKKCNRQKN